MDIAIHKKNQSFRLPVDLIERLRALAKRQNRSLNNYVETLLLDAAYHEPNDLTITAMREAQSGALRGACVGLLYMALGVVCYCLLMGSRVEMTGYLADLGMGLAAGGLFGMILSGRKGA